MYNPHMGYKTATNVPKKIKINTGALFDGIKDRAQKYESKRGAATPKLWCIQLAFSWNPLFKLNMYLNISTQQNKTRQKNNLEILFETVGCVN